MAGPGYQDRFRDGVGNASHGRASCVVRVVEIFQSRQGEGLCVGDPQIFLRLGGCNLVCDYCDTPDSIPLRSGNALNPADILSRIESLRQESGASVLSLTGGEPLAQTD